MKPLDTTIAGLLFLSFAACSSNEIGYSKDVNPETVYMDYAIHYTEGEDSINCLLQYRFAGENGTTLVLSSPSKVSIDGKEIKADSSSFTGAYYEKKFSVANFTGDHTIEYTDVNSKARKEIFHFNRIRLANDILSANKQTDLVLKFENTNDQDMIEVNLSDTSAATDDIEIKSKLIGGKLTISPIQLQSLSSGPCSLYIYKNLVQPLQQPTTEGGKLSINYVIREIEIELRAMDAAPVTTL